MLELTTYQYISWREWLPRNRPRIEQEKRGSNFFLQRYEGLKVNKKDKRNRQLKIPFKKRRFLGNKGRGFFFWLPAALFFSLFFFFFFLKTKKKKFFKRFLFFWIIKGMKNGFFFQRVRAIIAETSFFSNYDKKYKKELLIRKKKEYPLFEVFTYLKNYKQESEFIDDEYLNFMKRLKDPTRLQMVRIWNKYGFFDKDSENIACNLLIRLQKRKDIKGIDANGKFRRYIISKASPKEMDSGHKRYYKDHYHTPPFDYSRYIFRAVIQLIHMHTFKVLFQRIVWMMQRLSVYDYPNYPPELEVSRPIIPKYNSIPHSNRVLLLI